MPRRGLVFALLACALSAEEATVGVAVPLTLTGEAVHTHRLKTEDPGAGTVAGGFRAMLYPTLKLGSNWFTYSALQLHSTPFFYHETPEPQHRVDLQVIQAFVGYSRTAKRGSVIVKAGQLSSAFGSFPLRYDDAENPLLDQPLSHTAYLKLRPDQLPCGVGDMLRQRLLGREVDFECGGSETDSDGMVPATLYGLPGIEADFAVRRVDARIQLTNSSPANPQNLLSRSQHIQWTAGAGYTIRHGLRVGYSAFRGPYLDRVVSALLPAGRGVRDFPATGAGVDVQWARARWSTSGEWQRFRFSYPGFRTPPTVSFGYVEVKAVVNPRFFVAARAGFQRHNRVADSQTRSSEAFSPDRQSYELGAGYRLNRQQLLKIGYEWLRTDGVSGTRDNVLGIQFVTTLHSIEKALR
ncbi:MAG: hypothetical protein HYR60_09580 [Acidobacteria bacterium]|nr:hypothetical protein [Acidobacteriota bacterium]